MQIPNKFCVTIRSKFEKLKLKELVFVDWFDELICIILLFKAIMMSLHFVCFLCGMVMRGGKTCIHYQRLIIISIGTLSFVLGLAYFYWCIFSFDWLLYHLVRCFFEWTKGQWKDIETVLVLIFFTIFHHIKLCHAHFIIFDRVKNIIFLEASTVVSAIPIQKMFEVINLSNLAVNG